MPKKYHDHPHYGSPSPELKLNIFLEGKRVYSEDQKGHWGVKFF